MSVKVNGFVEPRAAVGSLKERCDNVRHLTITEQDAQASFLAMIERRNQLILQLAADDAIASNSAFQLVKSKVGEEMNGSWKVPGWVQRSVINLARIGGRAL